MTLLKYIYFLRPVCSLGPIKIGASADPASRLRAYQIWSPVELEIAAFVEAHRNTEQFLHRHFLAQWKHGEWFDWSCELQRLIDHVNSFGSLPGWVTPPRSPLEYKAFLAKYPKGKTPRRLMPGGVLPGSQSPGPAERGPGDIADFVPFHAIGVARV